MKMNQLTKITLSLFLVSLLTVCAPFAQSPQVKNEKTVQIKVTGMTCSGCSNHVSKVLKETPGIIDNWVEYPGNIAKIKYDADKVNPETIAKASTAYPATVVNDKTIEL